MSHVTERKRRLKTPCATPGAIYTIATTNEGFTVSVQMAEGIDLGSLSKDDVSDFHEAIHEYAEDLAFRMIRQSRMREGKFDALPDSLPDARASNDDHNAMEIIRRAAARMAKDDPSLLDEVIA